ncbi:hypothetical protein ABZX39_17860 [Streptomyces collinus]|uniref:hypothetical protein n=1 Tax=Streptomyces collinus TaxID=42684 RepID=UPI0033BEAC4F
MELSRRGRAAARPAAPAALLALLALLAGCASPGPSSPVPSAAGRAGTRAATAPTASGPGRSDYTYRLPLAAYSYSDAEYAVIESAQRILARDCMKGFGLSYRPVRKSASGTTSDRRYGISDMAVAARYGYHLPPEPRNPGTELGPEQRDVLYGKKSAFHGKAVPDAGCLGWAVRKLAEPYAYPAGVTAASAISAEGFRASMRDRGVRALFARWSACMKGKGYRYASPLDPFRDHGFTDGRVTARERRTATADMACKGRTGLLESWLRAEAGIQRGMIRKRITVLRRLRDLHRQKVSAARRIVSGT